MRCRLNEPASIDFACAEAGGALKYSITDCGIEAVCDLLPEAEHYFWNSHIPESLYLRESIKGQCISPLLELSSCGAAVAASRFT